MVKPIPYETKVIYMHKTHFSVVGGHNVFILYLEDKSTDGPPLADVIEDVLADIKKMYNIAWPPSLTFYRTREGYYAKVNIFRDAIEFEHIPDKMAYLLLAVTDWSMAKEYCDT